MNAIDTIVLTEGSHASREDGMCAMEAVAWLAGEAHSDAPACVCPVIAAAMRAINDRLDDADRQQLVPYLQRVIGTRGDAALERRRGFAAADWAVRVAAPRALRACGLADAADRLASLSPVVDVSTARTAQRKADAVSSTASAASTACAGIRAASAGIRAASAGIRASSAASSAAAAAAASDAAADAASAAYAAYAASAAASDASASAASAAICAARAEVIVADCLDAEAAVACAAAGEPVGAAVMAADLVATDADAAPTVSALQLLDRLLEVT
jgi:hypothetical protein